MTTIEVIEKTKDSIISVSKETKILASLSMAQLILESGNMTSELSKKANNLFGIKGNYKGASYTIKTQEYVDGKMVTVNAEFRKYPSINDSIKDHGSLLSTSSRYKNLVGEKDYKKACVNIQKDGYATDPNYSTKLMNLIEKNKLYELDSNESLPDLSGYVGGSIVDGLRSVNAKYSMAYRRFLAIELGIEGYKGTAEQNQKMIVLLGGKLSDSNTKKVSLKGYKGFSIVDGLKAFGYPSDMTYRKALAIEYGIKNYVGTSEQNIQLLNILKSN